MIIDVSQGFIDNSYNELNKNRGAHVNNEIIYEHIKTLLIFENIIADDTKISWRIIKEKFQGVVLDEKKIVYFTQFLTLNGKTKSRNTFASQNINPIYKYANKNEIFDISVSLNPFDLQHYPIKLPRTIIKDLSSFKTQGITINKSLQSDKIISFTSINQYVQIRNELRKSTNYNRNSTLIKIFDDLNIITVYGNFDGASGVDTLNCLRLINNLRNSSTNIKEFWTLNIGTDVPSKKIIKYIEEELQFKYIHNHMINGVPVLRQFLNSQIINESKEYNAETIKRNQPFFIQNILRKYKEYNITTCFCCSYSIVNNLIASHIHRFADIRKEFEDNKIDAVKATELSISGDNGFMLCPNHDKEFENGQIYFDVNSLKMVASDINEAAQKDYINSLIVMQPIPKDLLNDLFLSNVQKHITRTKANH